MIASAYPGRHVLTHLLAAVLVAAAMTGFLGFQIEKRAAILRDGTAVLLKTAPVDPRDLLRGDYVILSYDIGNIPTALVTGPLPTPYSKAPLWVRLRLGADGFWAVAEASFVTLPPSDGSVVLRSLPTSVINQPSEGGSYFVDYGIESYYVPEGEGLAIEQARNQSLVTVSVSVSAGGDGQIRALLVDGVPAYEEPLY